MNSSLPSTSIVVVLFSLITLFPSSQLTAEQLGDQATSPLLPGEDRLICDFEPGGVGGETSFGWLQYNRTKATFSPPRFGSTRTKHFQSRDQDSPDANRDGQLSRVELATLADDRRLRLLQRYDSDADGQLSRYELPQNLAKIDWEQAIRNGQPPQPASPSSRQPFENLRRFGLPTTRQASVRSQPFAQAATFGTVGGFTRSGFVSTSAPSCCSSRSSTYLLLYSR